MIIESSKNNLFRSLMSLQTSKGIKSAERALVSGAKIAQEVAGSSKGFWITHPEIMDQVPDTLLTTKDVCLSKELFDQVDLLGTHSPLFCSDIRAFLELDQLDPEKSALFLALSDPNNLGAVVRSALAFGWDQVVLTSEAAHPFLPKATRAASAANFQVQFFKGPSIHQLDLPNFFALDMGGVPLTETSLPQAMNLLVGEEGQGVPVSFKGQRLSIPMSDKIESLNATIATSVLLYEWRKLNC